MTPRDTQRAKVYAAEEFVRTLFDRAAEHGNQVVEFFGTQLTLPPEGPRRGPHRPHIGHKPTLTDPRLVRNFPTAPERTT